MNVRGAIIDNPDSVAERKRARRWADFVATFPQIADMRVLDLGGTVQSWERAPIRPHRVHCINPYEPEVRCGALTSERADACSRGTWEHASVLRKYDLVYSNSVIEHVGGHERRKAFASVVSMSAYRHWIQTPYRYFPFEPHMVAPLAQFLPLAIRARLSMFWPLHTRPHDYNDAVVTQMNTELLDITLMRLYFPDSQLRYERMAGLVKSVTAVKA